MCGVALRICEFYKKSGAIVIKKFSLPIIIAAVLIVGAVTAVIMNRDNANGEKAVSEAENGRYYLNGDKGQKIWMDVNSDFLTLGGDDADDHLMNCAKKQYEDHENADEIIRSYYEDLKLLYCGEKYYSVKFLRDTMYTIEVSRYGDDTSAVYPIEGGDKATFSYYKDENRINCSLGNFILFKHDVSTDVELKSGKYYLNGDKNSDLWVVVTPDFLQLQGKDVDSFLMDEARKSGVSDEAIDRYFEEIKALYCAEKIYLLQDFLPEKSQYSIKVSRDNKHTDIESLKKNGACFIFNSAKNSISLGSFGDFIPVKD